MVHFLVERRIREKQHPSRSVLSIIETNVFFDFRSVVPWLRLAEREGVRTISRHRTSKRSQSPAMKNTICHVPSMCIQRAR